MSWWALLIGVFATWVLWSVAATSNVAVEDARRGIPQAQRRRVSILPIIPIFPIVFWAAAQIADLAVSPWGTLIVGLLHIVLAVVLVVSIIRDLWRLRLLDHVQ
jgi:hypothetical protein